MYHVGCTFLYAIVYIAHLGLNFGARVTRNGVATMGLDYSVNLYFRVEDVERALLATVGIAHVDAIERNLSVTLPNRKTIDLPFTSHFETEPVELAVGGRIQLDTVLLFPQAKEIFQYLGERDGFEVIKDGKAYYRLGMIYLHVRCGQEYAEFAYFAATSGMSRLFLNSTTIQYRFLELLSFADGILGLFDIESFEYPLLENTSVRLRQDNSDLEDWLSEHWVDRFVNWVKEAKSD